MVKRTDFTFIVACLLLHDLIKSGFIMQKSFSDYVTLLFNSGFVKGTFINGSIFLRKDKEVELKESKIFSIIQMSDKEYEETKEMMKKKNFGCILQTVFKNCDMLLQDIFGKITYNYLNNVEYIPIFRRNKYNTTTKYFLTSKDYLFF